MSLLIFFANSVNLVLHEAISSYQPGLYRECGDVIRLPPFQGFAQSEKQERTLIKTSFELLLDMICFILITL